jgi:hypothetical protein
MGIHRFFNRSGQLVFGRSGRLKNSDRSTSGNVAGFGRKNVVCPMPALEGGRSRREKRLLQSCRFWLKNSSRCRFADDGREASRGDGNLNSAIFCFALPIYAAGSDNCQCLQVFCPNPWGIPAAV